MLVAYPLHAALDREDGERAFGDGLGDLACLERIADHPTTTRLLLRSANYQWFSISLTAGGDEC